MLEGWTIVGIRYNRALRANKISLYPVRRYDGTSDPLLILTDPRMDSRCGLYTDKNATNICFGRCWPGSSYLHVRI